MNELEWLSVDDIAIELYEKFPWARTGKYDNDASVWGGRAAIMVSDPLYLLMPWARAAQMGKLVGKGGLALSGLGAGVGAYKAFDVLAGSGITGSR